MHSNNDNFKQGSNAPKTAPNDSVNSVAPDDIHETDKRGNHCKSVTEDPKDNKDPTAVTTLEDPDINDENFSVQSICSETFVETDQKLMEVETGADAFTGKSTSCLLNRKMLVMRMHLPFCKKCGSKRESMEVGEKYICVEEL